MVGWDVANLPQIKFCIETNSRTSTTLPYKIIHCDATLPLPPLYSRPGWRTSHPFLAQPHTGLPPQNSHSVAREGSVSPSLKPPFFSVMMYWPEEFLMHMRVASRSSMKKPSGTSESAMMPSPQACQYPPCWPEGVTKLT